jgi:hypothetical protein
MKYGFEYNSRQHSLKLYYYQKQLLEIKKLQWGPQIILILNNALLDNQMTWACACGPVPSSKRIFCGFRCYNDKPKRGDVLQPS